jgi:hypothetical protein
VDACPTTPSPNGQAINGEVEDYYFGITPTGVVLSSLDAQAQGQAVQVTWETTIESNVLGFNVYRSEGAQSPPLKLNDKLIEALYQGQPVGAGYTFADSSAQAGVSYTYWVELIDTLGKTQRHGPIVARLPEEPAWWVYLPLAITIR